MYGGQKIVVVIPAYNEEQLIEQTLKGLPQYVDDVVLVDDGSKDRTVARALSVGDERLALVQHVANRGVGAAIVSGYRAALERKADVVVVVGGDAQMDPGEMERLVDPVVAKIADYVKGDRMGHPDVRLRMPRARFWANSVLTRATRWAVGLRHLRDSQCGYTAISASALSALPLETLWPRYGYPNDLLSLLTLYGFRVADRPVTPIYESEQSGIHPLTIGPIMLFVLTRMRVRRGLTRPVPSV
jgi:glycosyltransferase involved in cell wall biosynthesis